MRTVNPASPESGDSIKPPRNPLLVSGFADGGVPETTDQLLARMAAKYGTSGGTPTPPANPPPVTQVQAPAPAPAPTIIDNLKTRNNALQDAAKYATGGKIVGPGTPTSDSIDAQVQSTGEPIKVSTGERIISAAQDAMLEALAHDLGFPSLEAMLEQGTGKPVGPTVKDGTKAAAFGDKIEGTNVPGVVREGNSFSQAPPQYGANTNALNAPGITDATPTRPAAPPMNPTMARQTTGVEPAPQVAPVVPASVPVTATTPSPAPAATPPAAVAPAPAAVNPLAASAPDAAQDRPWYKGETIKLSPEGSAANRPTIESDPGYRAGPTPPLDKMVQAGGGVLDKALSGGYNGKGGTPVSSLFSNPTPAPVTPTTAATSSDTTAPAPSATSAPSAISTASGPNGPNNMRKAGGDGMTGTATGTVSRSENSFSGVDVGMDAKNPLATIDLAGNNDAMARENAIRQQTIDSQPGSVTSIGDSGRSETTALMDKWGRQDAAQSAINTIAGNPRTANALAHAFAVSAGSETAASRDATDRANQTDVTATARRGQDIRSQEEAAKNAARLEETAMTTGATVHGQDVTAQTAANTLAGNPLDQKLKGQSVATGERHAKMLDQLEKTVDPGARRNILDSLLAAQGKNPNEHRYIKVGGGEILAPDGFSKVKQAEGVYDSVTKQFIPMLPPSAPAAAQKFTVGKTYTDGKGNKSVYQADGTWKETK